MTDIHYFPRYSQPENFITNNTLLLLVRLYQYDRFKFQRFMEFLCGDSDLQLGTSWLHFRQQMGTGSSVVDGFIAQDSVKIAIETKLGESFDLGQLKRHLAAFAEEQHKLLLLLSPSSSDISATQLAQIRKLALTRNIQVLNTTFEEVIAKYRQCLSDHEEEMRALISDFEAFCSERELLPRDKWTLFVPPCGQSYEDNERYRLYYCPSTWSRRKAKYIGIYSNKVVRFIGEIVKIVDCTIDAENRVVEVAPPGGVLTADEENRIVDATINAENYEWNIRAGHRFYLCSSMERTDFRKTSKYGIWGHRYFDLEEVLGGKVPADIGEIANLLSSTHWRW